MLRSLVMKICRAPMTLKRALFTGEKREHTSVGAVLLLENALFTGGKYES